MILVVFGFIIIWALCLVYIGIPYLFKMLGGSYVFFFLLPLIVSICTKYKEYAKLLWSIVLTMFGIIVVNFLYSYFLYNYKNFNLFIRAYVVLIPVGCILLGYAFTLQSFLIFNKKDRINKKEDIEALNYFSGFVVAIFTIPLLSTISILLQFRTLNNINSIGFQYALGSLILGGLIFLFEVRKIPIETLNYFSKLNHTKFNIDIRKVKKCLIIGMSIFIVFSFLNELEYRKHWVIWIETITIFVIYVIFFYLFSKTFFKPISIHQQRPAKIYLPSLKNRRNIIIIGFLFLVCFFSIIIAAVNSFEHFIL